MFGRNVNVVVKGLGTFTIFVFCTPSTPLFELQIRAKQLLSGFILSGRTAGHNCSFRSEAADE